MYNSCIGFTQTTIPGYSIKTVAPTYPLRKNSSYLQHNKNLSESASMNGDVVVTTYLRGLELGLCLLYLEGSNVRASVACR